ncbi:MAG: acetamidase/formamidase family protein [Hyphomonadaceae bacterium]|nr:acetamidase/formamidase family protein [Hyphomonadaceae bacterium]
MDDSLVQYAWDNTHEPRLSVEPGDTVVITTRDSSDAYYSADSGHEDVRKKGPLKGHPLTGPIHVRGARPGDILAIEIVEVAPLRGFGWTAIRPGRGLLPQEEFPEHFLQIWTLDKTGFARMRQRDDIAVPVQSFPGIVGVALAETGAHSTIPPRNNGGNMDQKHLTAGSTLYLPVLVEGAMLSLGDAHAAQGDGEVCITAIEMAARVIVRVDLIKGRAIEEPQLRTGGPLCAQTNIGRYFATTSNSPDLFEASRQAIRYMITKLVRDHGLSREEAYILCSVCVDLKISQIVDAPNWTVSAFLPETVFV